MMSLRVATLVLVLTCPTAPAVRAATPQCERPWVYFDLGNTIIDMSDLEKKGESGTLRFLPGARKYLEELKARHTPIGVISNIPESWGKTLPSKILHLKSYVAGHWRGSDLISWSEFDAGIFVPASDKERKPAPILFERALKRASTAGCPAVYIGEDEKEVKAAQKVGLHAYQAGQKGNSFYLPESELKEILSAQTSAE